MEDVPFTVYFDFEITTGNTVFYAKMFYFMLYPIVRYTHFTQA